ncbi:MULTISPECIES: polysaccharide deacetylase family protein [Streptomyces]|uniref:Deacetylase n=1 Tax=Streptomyces albidoflavus TaxID=1886 RepID=A0AA37FB85_9ACTN|nr:polysaccharide deacetylase family protein [Streptomyces albidoflavus]MYX54089.1 polysaccharide deacetylase family protein [Streptomyces sp. SID8385]BDH50537.1 deacetylase [Streptomyces albus]AGI87898.1 Deacetylase [Streptomyces albidoflavus]MCL6278320.1 polysaccharide deacetylase family protein [Streptomyces albidoflavus]MCX4464099.1 polysaccharide deacetylase family protein [Streptomyces albidoflavus]
MNTLTHAEPRTRRPHRIRRIAVAALALAALTALTSCTPGTVAPADERARAHETGGDGKPGARVKLAGGEVDCAVAKCIALTFDGGPGKDTPALLDLLKREEVPATFFLLGRKHIEKYPETVRRIAKEGHEVANHTWNHPRLTEIEPDEIREELTRTQKELARLTGSEPTLMRPPQGRTDDTVSEISKELGLSQVLWSTTAKDYATNDSELITERTLDQAGRDGVILLHDIYKGTVPAVPGIIHALKKDGYTFVTVPQLMAPAEPVPGAIYRP